VTYSNHLMADGPPLTPLAYRPSSPASSPAARHDQPPLIRSLERQHEREERQRALVVQEQHTLDEMESRLMTLATRLRDREREVGTLTKTARDHLHYEGHSSSPPYPSPSPNPSATSTRYPQQAVYCWQREAVAGPTPLPAQGGWPSAASHHAEAPPTIPAHQPTAPQLPPPHRLPPLLPSPFSATSSAHSPPMRMPPLTHRSLPPPNPRYLADWSCARSAADHSSTVGGAGYMAALVSRQRRVQVASPNDWSDRSTRTPYPQRRTDRSIGTMPIPWGWEDSRPPAPPRS